MFICYIFVLLFFSAFAYPGEKGVQGAYAARGLAGKTFRVLQAGGQLLSY